MTHAKAGADKGVISTLWRNRAGLLASGLKSRGSLPRLKSMSYCTAIQTMSDDRQELHRRYHDRAYGFPIHDDNELFCRLILEINQAGLSWETILKKETSFRKAYSNFNIKKVAAYTAVDRKRLMENPGVIRNRLKINAAIENARTILKLQKEYGSFEMWLEAHFPRSKEEWVKLFKQTFRFTGGEIVNEFLVSIGYLPGAHDVDCAIYRKAARAKPRWIALRKKEEIGRKKA
jgi:DNA-3-methyladenine glycosylase I